MILGLGIDILDKNRVAKIYKKFDKYFANRILSDAEIELFSKIGVDDFDKKISFLTKRFSDKESLLKALGIGMGRGILLKDITLKNNKLGKPELFLNNVAKNFIKNYYNDIDFDKVIFFISLTDEKNLVNTAVVIDYDKTF